MLRRSTPTLLFKRFKHTVLGIDLGTTNSAVAVVGTDNQPQILENDEGKRTTPSIVAFTKDDKVLVGLPAKRQAVVNPENTFFATKRLIGRKFEDQEVQRDLNNVSYKIIPNNQGDATLRTFSGEIISPSEIGGLILQQLQKNAESQLDEKIDKAVVTVPAYFNDSQRQATKNSGKSIGLDILRVINEPTAAALAYGCDKSRKDGIIAVFDLGGGTFDISILEIDNGVFEVRATNGNTHLGGEDFDIMIMNHILQNFKNETGIDLSDDRFAVQRIREAAEKAKIELDHADEIEINIPFISGDKHIKQKLTEAEFDIMVQPIIEKTIEPVRKCVRDAEIKFKDIDEVLLVGGMTRMPKIRKVVEQLFGKEPSTAVNPDEAVALGAAIQGAVLSGQVKNVVLLDVTPLSLGIETYGGIFSPLIPRNSAVPIKKEQMFSTAVDGQTGVEIGVYQGERTLVKDNKKIGQFKLANIPQGPKGSPQIAVSFEIDADGIINVSATDKTKYPKDSPNYVTEAGLTDGEVEKMIQESAANKKADEEKRKLYEHASRAEILCTDTENALFQFGKLMEDEEKAEINAFLKTIKEMIDDIRTGKNLHDPNTLNQKVNDMQNVCMTAIRNVAAKQSKQ
ncbi:SSC1 Import motor subunit [Candida maltosa Xu316]